MRHFIAASLLFGAPAWAQIVNPDLSPDLQGWEVYTYGDAWGPGWGPGSVRSELAGAVLLEGGSFLVVLEQTFLLEPRTAAISFDMELSPGFDLRVDAIPDAFEARLLDAGRRALVEPWEPGNTAYFNLQETLEQHTGPDVSVTALGATAWRVRLDTSGVAPGQPVTLSFSLVGGDRDDLSSVRILGVDVEIANEGPLADAGGTQVRECGVEPALLDGTGSSDPDGDPLTFLWTDTNATFLSNEAQVSLDLPLGTWFYILGVTDPFGLSDEDVAVVEVVDTLPPALAEAAAGLTLEEDGSCAVATPDLTGLATVDACGPVTIAQDPPAGSPLNQGSSGEIVLILTDAGGNTTTALVPYSVLDSDGSCTNEAPIADAGADVSAECGVGPVRLSGAGSSDPDGDPLTFLWTDADGATLASSAEVEVAPGRGAWTYTLQVQDPEGLTDADQVVVRVVDSLPPELTGPPTGAEVEEDGSCVTGVVPDLTGGLPTTDLCGGVRVSQSPPAGSVAPLGPTEVELTAEDGSGNLIQVTVTLQVVDADNSCGNLPPVADAGADLTAECGAGPASLDGSASSDPDGDPLHYAWTLGGAPIADTAQTEVDPGPGTWTYTLQVQDPDGLTDADELTLDVVDTTPPSVDGAPGDAQVEEDGSCATGVVPDLTGGLVTADLCGGVSVLQSPPPGSAAPLGPTEVTIAVRDDAGNLTEVVVTLQVVDADDSCGNLPPTADAGADLTAECGAGPVSLDGAASSDPDGDPLRFAWTQDGTPIADTPQTEVDPGLGAWTYTLQVQDPGGLTDADDVTVEVVDTTPPMVDAWPADAQVEEDGSCAAGAVPDLTDVAAADLCGAVSVTQDPPAGSAAPLGDSTITVTARDAAGNAVSAEVRLEVVDADLSCVDDPPVADAGADVAAECGPGSVRLDGSASYDPEGTPLTWRWSDDAGELGTDVTVDVPVATPGARSYTLEVADAGGQTGEDTVTVAVADTTPPALLGALEDQQLEEVGCLSAPLPDWTGDGAADACDGALAVVQDPPPGTPVALGASVEVTVSAADGAGNTASVTLRVEVVDADSSCLPDTQAVIDTDDTELESDPPETDVPDPDSDPDSDEPPEFGTDKDTVIRQWRGGCGCDTGGGPGAAALLLLLALRRRGRA